MSRKRPSLQDVQRLYPQDLARCTGYVWHLGTRIGKGSFGEVYLGWTNNGKDEVAVKAVSKSYFKQDPKVRENLEREIRIMKLLRNCEYVVHLHHVQDMKQHIVLVMELCEYDLDYLVKASPFREDDITLFLFQLAQGMKALREQNIVHRDLKPGNILIKKDVVTGKMKIKLADFGFARHFTEEGTKKPVDMSSLAGTPVFMAPEALRCVFYPGEHYDDKVDIWSIGALLYKVIVGTCGFYAQLQDIPKILKHKKDAIAFERVAHSRSINYIYELPASVYDRFSADYRTKMNTLLVHLLKLDPQERMNFPEFFEFVDDLVSSKIEVVNLLQGTSGKIIYDTSMTLDQLKTEVHAQLGVAVAQQLLFSPHTPYSISPHTHLPPDKFAQLMEKCGARKGNGVLYLLPISDVQNSGGSPDDSCLAQLKFAVTDEGRCVELIKDHKFTNEVVHAINLLQTQQKRQLSGIEEFSKFCAQEMEAFKSDFGYQEVYGKGLKAVASASLAADWLGADLDGVPNTTPTEQAQSALKTLRQLKIDVSKLVSELDALYRSSEQQLKKAEQGRKPAINTDQPAELIKDAKKLPDLRQVEIFGRCQMILKRCQELLRQAWGQVHRELFGLWSSLSGVWTMMDRSKNLHKLCSQLDEVLTRTVPQVRSSLFSSLSSGVAMRSTRLNSPSPVQNPPMVVINAVNPMNPDWTRPPPTGQWSPGYQQSPPSPAYPQQTAMGSGGAESRELATLREEKDHFESLFTQKAQECADLAVQNQALQAQLKQRHRGSSTSEEERTLSPGQTLRPSTPTEEKTLRTSMSPDDVRVLESLREQLQQFCAVADVLKPGIAASVRPRSQTSPSSRKAQSPALYPALHGASELQDYSIISMPGTERQNSEGAKDKMVIPDDIHLLIPHATQLMSALKDGLKDMDQLIAENSVTGERTFIKIAKPKDYQRGDIVLFHPVKLAQTKVTAPALMHAEKPYPYILMDLNSYSSFGIRPGRIPELLVGKLLESPRSFRFENDPPMAKELGEAKGEFYRVRVESTAFKFVPKGAYRPPPPKAKGMGFMRLGHNKDV